MTDNRGSFFTGEGGSPSGGGSVLPDTPRGSDSTDVFVVSGAIDDSSEELRLTRSDSKVVTVDISSVFDASNNAKVSGVAWNEITNTLTINQSDGTSQSVTITGFEEEGVVLEANDHVVSGAYNSTNDILTLTRTLGGIVEIDLTPLAEQIVSYTNTFLSSGAISGSNLELTLNDSNVISVDISSLQGGVQLDEANTWADIQTFNAGIGVNSQKITDVLAPTADTDAANKAYVDDNAGEVNSDYVIDSFTGIVPFDDSTTDSLAIGVGVQLQADNAIAIGNTSSVSGDESIAIGRNAATVGMQAIAMGFGTTAVGDDAVSIGAGCAAATTNSGAFGHNAVARAINVITVGSDTQLPELGRQTATGDDDLAIATKKYVDDNSGGGGSAIVVNDGSNDLTTALSKLTISGSGVVVTEPTDDNIDIVISGGGGSDTAAFPSYQNALVYGDLNEGTAPNVGDYTFRLTQAGDNITDSANISGIEWIFINDVGTDSVNYLSLIQRLEIGTIINWVQGDIWIQFQVVADIIDDGDHTEINVAVLRQSSNATTFGDLDNSSDVAAEFGITLDGETGAKGDTGDTGAAGADGADGADGSGSEYVDVNSDGTAADASGIDAIAIGENAQATEGNSVAIGHQAVSNISKETRIGGYDNSRVTVPLGSAGFENLPNQLVTRDYVDARISHSETFIVNNGRPNTIAFTSTNAADFVRYSIAATDGININEYGEGENISLAVPATLSFGPNTAFTSTNITDTHGNTGVMGLYDGFDGGIVSYTDHTFSCRYEPGESFLITNAFVFVEAIILKPGQTIDQGSIIGAGHTQIQSAEFQNADDTDFINFTVVVAAVGTDNDHILNDGYRIGFRARFIDDVDHTADDDNNIVRTLTLRQADQEAGTYTITASHLADDHSLTVDIDGNLFLDNSTFYDSTTGEIPVSFLATPQDLTTSNFSGTEDRFEDSPGISSLYGNRDTGIDSISGWGVFDSKVSGGNSIGTIDEWSDLTGNFLMFGTNGGDNNAQLLEYFNDAYNVENSDGDKRVILTQGSNTATFSVSDTDVHFADGAATGVVQLNAIISESGTPEGNPSTDLDILLKLNSINPDHPNFLGGKVTTNGNGLFQSLQINATGVSLGRNSFAHDGGVALGGSGTDKGGANATGINSIALSKNSTANGTQSVAIGCDSTAERSGSVAIGEGSTAGFAGSGALGLNATARTDNVITVGSSIALAELGRQTTSSDDDLAIATKKYVDDNSVSGSGEVYFAATGATADDETNPPTIDGFQSVAIGLSAQTTGTRAIAIGSGAESGLEDSDDQNGNIAIGASSHSCGTDNVALGRTAETGDVNNAPSNSVAIGTSSKVISDETVAIGTNIDVGVDTDKSVLIGDHAGSPLADDDSGTQVDVDNAIMIGQRTGLIDDAAADQDSPLAIGNGAQAAPKAIALGKLAKAFKESSIAIGDEAQATIINSIAIGNAAESTGTQSVALGNLSEATANGSTGLGESSTASAANTTAVGSSTTASGDSATAIGSGAIASFNFSSAIGNGAQARANFVTTIGSTNTLVELGRQTTTSDNDLAVATKLYVDNASLDVETFISDATKIVIAKRFREVWENHSASEWDASGVNTVRELWYNTDLTNGTATHTVEIISNDDGTNYNMYFGTIAQDVFIGRWTKFEEDANGKVRFEYFNTKFTS